ncbi:hypothetical protein Patl1_15764 [Pistacia atlantica]|uniref:Uncharacterized protein n=1 Tax=Pistacia atlantica TaxID=434234 RepID=A0ACC1B8S6_9ROSI|nr:hypothetical protein Patl1_15764 [Pistacia atlantica]
MLKVSFKARVAKVLPQVVRSITLDDARRLFHESRESGSAVVIVAVKQGGHEFVVDKKFKAWDGIRACRILCPNDGTWGITIVNRAGFN